MHKVFPAFLPSFREKSSAPVQYRNCAVLPYIIQGYAINEKRLEALQKTVDICSITMRF